MFSYIILHYKNIDETMECLKCLKQVVSKKSHIIVVDNNSLKSEEEREIKKYTKDILKLDENYGFAKANNKGINYAKEKYNSKYYVVINNDVLIKQKSFEVNIENAFEKYSFDILGPKIDSPSGESVNPFPAFKNLLEIKKEIKRCKKLILIYDNKILSYLLKNYIRIKYFIKKPVLLENGNKLEKNIPLHGCALIFSEKYLNKYKDAFYNDTFLYHEEEFLFQRVINEDLISIYDPKIKVFHKEGSSLNNIYANNRKKLLFQTKERLKSLELLQKFIEVNYEKK